MEDSEIKALFREDSADLANQIGDARDVVTQHLAAANSGESQHSAGAGSYLSRDKKRKFFFIYFHTPY